MEPATPARTTTDTAINTGAANRATIVAAAAKAK